MSSPGDIDFGYAVARHHDESYEIDFRATRRMVEFVTDRDDSPRAAAFDGDVVGALYWPAASQSQIVGAAVRPTGGWGFAWPARVVPGEAQPGPTPGAGGRTISRADAASRDAGPSLAVRPLAGAGWVDQSFAAQGVPSQALASVADRDDFTRPGIVGDPVTKPGARPGVADGELGATPKTPGSSGASIGSQRTIPATENGSGWGGSWVPPQGWPVIAMAGTEAYAHHEVLMPAANGVVLASEFTYSGGADGDRVPVTASPAWGARPDGRVEYVGTLSSLMTPWHRSVALDMRTKRNHTTGELETARIVGWPEARRSNTYYRSADLGETFSIGRGQGIGSDDHAGQVHIKTNAPFIDAGQPFPFDGPLRFELQRSPGAIEGTIPHATHLQFSEADRSWAWHSAVNVYTDDPPDEPGEPEEPADPGTPGDPNGPPTPPPGGDDGRPGGGMGRRPRTPGDDGSPPGLLPGGSATPGTDTLPPQGVGDGDDPFDPIFPPPERDRIPRLGPSGFTPGVPPVVLHNAIDQRQYAQRTAGSPHEWHAPGFVIRARPMGWDERRTSVIPGDGYLEREKLREFQRSPAVGMFWGWCQESGGAFVTDELEGDRFRECTVGAGGGMVFGPPEINPRDVACGGEGLPSGRRVRERTLLALADYAYFGTGTPCHKTGGITTGWRWGQDSGNGDRLRFEFVDADGVTTITALDMQDDGLVASLEIRPITDGNINLGSSSRQWGHVYTGGLTASSTATFGDDASFAGEIAHTGSSLGFFGATTVAQQDEPTTLAEVVSVLQAYGLCA